MRTKSCKETKDVMFTVRLSASQLERLQKHAAEYGVTEAEYVRSIIDQKPLTKVQTIKDINALRLELHYVSNNLNQVAHALNGQYYNQKEAAEKAREVNGKVEEVVRKIMEAFDYD